MKFFKFPYTNFHEMNLDWIIEKVQELVENFIQINSDFGNLNKNFEELKKYVEDYFIKLNINVEVKKIIEEMRQNGELENIISEALLSGSLKRVNSPTVLILGDSYAEGTNIADKSKSWANIMKDTLTKNGYGVTVKAVGGYGFKADGTKTFSNLVNTVNGEMSENDRKRVTKIIIGGSYNDRNSAENDISNGMIDCINSIRSKFVNAKDIVICPMGWTWEGHQQGIHTSTTYISVMKANKIWQYTASTLGCSVIPAYQAMLYESSFSNDGVHPSEQGQKNILNMIMQSFGGVYTKPINSIEYGTTAKIKSGLTGKLASKIRYSVFNGTTKARCLQMKLSETTLPETKLDGTGIEVGTIDSPAIHFGETELVIPCSFIVRGKETDSGGEANLFIQAPGWIEIHQKKIILHMTYINPQKRNYIKYDINSIEAFNFGEFVYDALFQ